VVDDAGHDIHTGLPPRASPSEDVRKFNRCFCELGAKTAQAEVDRGSAWLVADPNGNGHCSLAEADRFVLKRLHVLYGEAEGKRLYKHFKPSYIRAFNDAKDIGKDRAIGGISATGDDYVQKGEFRLLNAFFCTYAMFYDAFELLDGDDARQTDDRRMELREWMASYQRVQNFGFVALRPENIEDPAKVFKEMDIDGKGMVLLMEFCTYLKKKEIEAHTSAGKILQVGEHDGSGHGDDSDGNVAPKPSFIQG
jgi:hypothetical protein